MSKYIILNSDKAPYKITRISIVNTKNNKPDELLDFIDNDIGEIIDILIMSSKGGYEFNKRQTLLQRMGAEVALLEVLWKNMYLCVCCDGLFNLKCAIAFVFIVDMRGRGQFYFISWRLLTGYNFFCVIIFICIYSNNLIIYNMSKRSERIGLFFMKHIKENFKEHENINILEIGGRTEYYYKEIITNYFHSATYMNMDIENIGENVIIGDITNCPHIGDNTYDLIISSDVFEHIDEPWNAAEQITRILKPNGITLHSTLFSWRFHPCPNDYFRFTHEGMKVLFKRLNHIESYLDDTERRRNIIKHCKSNIPNTVDELGGWRENWRVNYAGKSKN